MARATSDHEQHDAKRAADRGPPASDSDRAQTPGGPGSAPGAAPAAPESVRELFLAFSGLALRGFGGVLPWAQRVLVEERRWLTNDDFVELLSLSQLLPGPNVCNLAVMVGDRWFGLRGAAAALGGMLAVPMALVLALAVLYSGVSDQPVVVAALRGMGAVSAGLIIAMALKLVPSQRRNLPGWFFLAGTFAAVGLLRMPLIWVMLAMGAASVLVARWRMRG